MASSLSSSLSSAQEPACRDQGLWLRDRGPVQLHREVGVEVSTQRASEEVSSEPPQAAAAPGGSAPEALRWVPCPPSPPSPRRTAGRWLPKSDQETRLRLSPQSSET